MNKEVIVVEINETRYWVNPIETEYGCDELGNLFYLGEDYLDAIQLRSEVTDQGEFYFVHRDNNKRMREDLFICLCFNPYDKSNVPTEVRHIDGDKLNNTPSNLEWVFDEVID